MKQDARNRLHSLQGYIQNALDIISTFPDLPRYAALKFGLREFVEESTERKEELINNLRILQSETQKIAQRIDMPILVGVIGTYSSGKSTLLNAFFDHIFEGKVPPHLVRPVSNTATDDKFTYITHTDFTNKFAPSEEVNVISVDHDLFKLINFIDTPGTDWEKFTRKAVSDLLSSADIMLFLFKPTEILHFTSVEALYIKFTAYKHIPIWYIVTNGAHYAKFGDWNTIRLDEFGRDLIDSKDKLRIRKADLEEEALHRDLVVQSINFSVGENTHLVDGREHYQTQALLAKIVAKFTTPEAKLNKTAQLYDLINEKYKELGALLLKAEKHILNLSHILQNAYSNGIRDGIGMYSHNTIVARAALISELLFAEIRQRPLDIDVMPEQVLGFDIIESDYTGPEIARFRKRLKDLRRNHADEKFFFKETDLVFDSIEMKKYFQHLRDGLLNKFGQNVDIYLNDLSPNAIERDDKFIRKWQNYIDIKIPEHYLSPELSTIFDSNKKKAERVHEKFVRESTRIAELHNVDQIELTIFYRQQNLLYRMELGIPTQIQKTQEIIEAVAQQSNDYTSSTIKIYHDRIQKEVAKLEEDTSKYMMEYVFRPTKEALEYLFGDFDSIETENSLKSKKTSMDIVGTLNEIYSFIEDAITNHRKNSIILLKEYMKAWRNDWDKLKKDYERLVEVATDISDTLEDITRNGSSIIEKHWVAGETEIQTGMHKLRANLLNIILKHEQEIKQSLIRFKKESSRKESLEQVGILLGIGVSVLDIYTIAQNPDQNIVISLFVLTIFIGLMLFSIASFTRTRNLKEKLASKLIQEAIKNMETELSENLFKAEGEIVNIISTKNSVISNELIKFYDEILLQAETSGRDIVPKVDDQIKTAAKLAVKTTRDITSLEKKAAHSIVSTANTHLNSLCENIENKIKVEFQHILGDVKDEYVSSLEGYISQYRNQVRQLGNLRRDLEA